MYIGFYRDCIVGLAQNISYTITSHRSWIKLGIIPGVYDSDDDIGPTWSFGVT